MLSVNEVIVSQKSSNEDRKLHFFGGAINEQKEREKIQWRRLKHCHKCLAKEILILQRADSFKVCLVFYIKELMTAS